MTESTTQPKKIILDCDPGIDDALAIMLACASPELELVGVTVTAGNSSLENGTRNALAVLHLMGRDDIPVYTGANQPLVIPARNAEDTHGGNGLGGVDLEAPSREALPGAVDFIADTLNKNEDVTVCAVGPLTNIAELVQKHPEAAKKMKQLVLMGGSWQTPGNCSPVAEFNFWFDPHAADLVFSKLKRPITMTSLDVTRKAVFTPNHCALLKTFGDKKADALVDMLQFYNDFHWEQEGQLGSVINDPLAVAQIIDDTICTGPDVHVQMITEGPAEGMSMVDESGRFSDGKNCKALTDCNSKAFLELFMTTVFPEHKKEITALLDNPVYGVPA